MDAKDQEIVRLRSAGKKAREIMQELGVSCSRVTRVLHECGLANGRMSIAQKESILALAETGISNAEISRQVGCTKTTVANVLKKANEPGLLINNAFRVDGDVAVIELTKGRVAIIDLADLEKVKALRWCAAGKNERPYAMSQIKGERVYLHRYLLGITGELFVDHVNHNTLDNRRANLKPVNAQMNAFNARMSRDNGRGRGVVISSSGKFFGIVSVSTPCYDTAEEASAARVALIERLYGQGVTMTEKFNDDDKMEG